MSQFTVATYLNDTLLGRREVTATEFDRETEALNASPKWNLSPRVWHDTWVYSSPDHDTQLIYIRIF